MKSNYENSELRVGFYTKDEQANDKVEFNFVAGLSANQKMNFVKTVLAFVCANDMYFPFLKDVAFDYAVVKFFANHVDILEVLDINEATDDYVDLAEELNKRTNIAKIIKANLPQSLIAELSVTINKNIEIKTGLHKDSLSDALAGLLITAENKLKDINLEEMTGLAKIMSSMAGEVTPEKTLKALAKSDIHKGNLNKVIGEKNQKITELQGVVKDYLASTLEPAKKG